MPLIEFMTGIDLDYIPQQLEVPEERQFTSISSDDQESQIEENEQQFIIKIRGLKNRGATCYDGPATQGQGPPLPILPRMQRYG